MSDILSVRALSKTFTSGGGAFSAGTHTVHALRDVSFDLAQGSITAIVGESGSGKSTLARIICGLLKPDAGEVLINGRAIASYTRLEYSRCVQMIFQDPYLSLNPRLSIGTMIAEALFPDGSASAITHLLDRVGLAPDTAASYPHQFSGGQRQRIAIARALARTPQLLIADEPLSALDIGIQNQLRALFTKIVAEQGISMLFITHDLVMASCIADQLIVLKDGAIVEHGSAGDLLKSPETMYLAGLIRAVPTLRPFGTPK